MGPEISSAAFSHFSTVLIETLRKAANSFLLRPFRFLKAEISFPVNDVLRAKLLFISKYYENIIKRPFLQGRYINNNV